MLCIVLSVTALRSRWRQYARSCFEWRLTRSGVFICSRYLQISRHSATSLSRSRLQRISPLHPLLLFSCLFAAQRPSHHDTPITMTGQQVTSDAVDDGLPISVPDSGDTGESGKLKMIIQLVRKCMGIKDIASMSVFTAQSRARC